MAVNYYFSYRNLFPRAGGVRESQIIFKGERVEVLSELSSVFAFCSPISQSISFLMYI